jgi:hypothetical protein
MILNRQSFLLIASKPLPLPHRTALHRTSLHCCTHACMRVKRDPLSLTRSNQPIHLLADVSRCDAMRVLRTRFAQVIVQPPSTVGLDAFSEAEEEASPDVPPLYPFDPMTEVCNYDTLVLSVRAVPCRAHHDTSLPWHWGYTAADRALLIHWCSRFCLRSLHLGCLNDVFQISGAPLGRGVYYGDGADVATGRDFKAGRHRA